MLALQSLRMEGPGAVQILVDQTEQDRKTAAMTHIIANSSSRTQRCVNSRVEASAP
jgi:hypothetical protein